MFIIPFFSIGAGTGDMVMGEPWLLPIVPLMLLGGEVMLFLPTGAGLEVLEWGLM